MQGQPMTVEGAAQASGLDADTRDDVELMQETAAVDAFAAERGVQLLAEVVVSGEPLSAVIEEAAPLDPAVQAELGDF